MEKILFVILGLVITVICVPVFLKKENKDHLWFVVMIVYILSVLASSIVSFVILVLNIELTSDRMMLMPNFSLGILISWIILIVFYKKIVKYNIIDRRTIAEINEDYKKAKDQWASKFDQLDPKKSEEKLFTNVGSIIRKTMEDREQFVKEMISENINKIEKDVKLTPSEKIVRINSMRKEIDNFLDALNIRENYSDEKLGRDFMEVIKNIHNVISPD